MSNGCGCFYMEMQRRGLHYCPLSRGPANRERVKFGVPLDEVCKDGIPGSLLVLILKLNAEGPYKKEIFRAPGNWSMVKKLTQVLREGHSVNLQEYSVHTVASVLKIFLQKLPDGIFGRTNELRLFQIMELDNVEKQRAEMHRIIITLPSNYQHLLVLLMGMFKLISSVSDRARTGMSAEALGVSVAPSIIHCCVSNGKHVRMEDVENFKVASRVITFLIENFGASNIFGRDNYEYFSITTRRLFRSNGRWSFRLKCHAAPPITNMSGDSDSESPLKTKGSLKRSSPLPDKDLVSCPELNTCITSHVLSEESAPKNAKTESATLLDITNTPGGESVSLYDLPEVHHRQTERMRARSEWFLTPSKLAAGQAPSRIPLNSIDWNGVRRALDESHRLEVDASPLLAPHHHHHHHLPRYYHPSPLLTPHARRGCSSPPEGGGRHSPSQHTSSS